MDPLSPFSASAITPDVPAPAPLPGQVQSKVQVYDVSIFDPQNSTPIIFKDDSPLAMLRRDFWILIKNAGTLLWILSPPPAPGRDVTNKGILLQGILILGSLVLTTLGIASFVIGFPPPILSVLLVVIWCGAFNLRAGKERVTYQNVPGNDKDDKEVWLFVNGIGTSKSGLKLILDTFYKLFGRRVIGVHNRTFGIWFDLIECMLQRDLFWATTDTREGYNIISQHIADSSKEKIVLLAHSQGGIIMSAWADQLLADFSYAQLKKVEIYTFASAANHFSIPESGVGPSFGCVEHFVNQWDYVSDIGLLAFAPDAPNDLPVNSDTVPQLSGRFAGRIFKRLRTTGHLLNTHYLSPNNSILDDPAVRKHSKLATYLLSPQERAAQVERNRAEKESRKHARALEETVAGPSSGQT
ncbi:uncharacterized protein I206_105124 [Kwoniella pini CBS 10737]|uniref:DUF676 domain-containing protein n=1 Tax=Kwoniella pini CBS 10737 TaxID=1296096 RepID=A0A1B9I8U6_9TREE|nr:uncharacterized protein I206_02665 [Kwoniella pini CBS 10737]OCF51949.1 hypothetical protein I206_02665 [Kwoniella pini CBS 10737]